MKQKIIDGLSIFLSVATFILAIYSLSGPQKNSVILDVALAIFAAAISIAILCYVIFDKEDKEK